MIDGVVDVRTGPANGHEANLILLRNMPQTLVLFVCLLGVVATVCVCCLLLLSFCYQLFLVAVPVLVAVSILTVNVPCPVVVYVFHVLLLCCRFCFLSCGVIAFSFCVIIPYICCN